MPLTQIRGIFTGWLEPFLKIDQISNFFSSTRQYSGFDSFEVPQNVIPGYASGYANRLVVFNQLSKTFISYKQELIKRDKTIFY